MRTTITLESTQLDQLMRETNTKSKSKAVTVAVEDFLRRKQLAKISKMKGKLEFTLTAEEIRHFER